MKDWKELTAIQKILIGAFVITLVILVPESAFLLDAGGIDLLLFILFMYSQNIRLWVDLHFGFLKYPMIETRAFAKSISLTSVLFWVTSSFVFSSSFFLVLMFMKKEF
jgi:hypothetical protein